MESGRAGTAVGAVTTVKPVASGRPATPGEPATTIKPATPGDTLAPDDTASPGRAAASRRGVNVGFGPRFIIPLFIGTSLNPINTTMISVALVPIAHDVEVSAATCIWLVAILYLVSSICQPTMGKLADQFGPRKIYLFGLCVVMVAGIIPTLSPTFPGALIARLLIGIGTSCAYPSAMAFIADQSTRLSRQAPPIVVSCMSIAGLVTTAIGPVLGGVLIAFFGWTSIFLVNIPMAAIDMVLMLLWMPADSTRCKPTGDLPLSKSIDFLGIALFAITIASALLFLLDLKRGFFWLMGIACVACILLVIWERRRERPFLDVRMLASHAPLRRTYWRFFLYFTGNYLVVYGLTQWTQASMGLSSDVAGLVQLPMAILAATASIIVMRSSKIFLPLVLTAALSLVAAVLTQTLDAGTTLPWLIVVFTLFGLPHGLGSVANQQAIYRQAPLAQMGNAAGLSRTALQVGAVVASCIIAGVFGDVATDGGMHALGIIIVCLDAACLLLTLVDRSLRGSAKDADRR